MVNVQKARPKSVMYSCSGSAVGPGGTGSTTVVDYRVSARLCRGKPRERPPASGARTGAYLIHSANSSKTKILNFTTQDNGDEVYKNIVPLIDSLTCPDRLIDPIASCHFTFNSPPRALTCLARISESRAPSFRAQYGANKQFADPQTGSSGTPTEGANMRVT